MQNDNSITSAPGMSFHLKSWKIHIFRSTVTALKEPEYIRFLFNPEKRRIAVQACKKKEPESFRVPPYDPENWVFPISSQPLSSLISQCCEWEQEKTYRIYGELYEKYNLVEFDLNHAVIYAEDSPCDT